MRSRETQEQGKSRVKIKFHQIFDVKRISFGLSENLVLPEQIGVWVRHEAVVWLRKSKSCQNHLQLPNYVSLTVRTEQLPKNYVD